MTEFEQSVMTLIASAGESKTKAFEALKLVKESKYEEARKLLDEAREEDIEAHKIQTQLIINEMNGGDNRPELNLLMVHAQDHYMTAQLARDLIEEMINVFEAKEAK
ncbi:PTS system, cellobiose-specific IIA component [Granulicatella balaenopterae]|uniref:PTS system, cellobiose-specific IIA component n=1 Tax=Granulicatella balaenopterae TaxID=137733 RepID=A0A1H9LXX4_9LACT|nr:PTS lactose/cellobiose transporter subunit IIA [Granulicatella balaenopterae]SER16149.1 PTS system, cellobiose-specific IIA component [Granulicatella balaenopterae]